MNITDAFFVEYPGHLFSSTTKGMRTEAVKLRNYKKRTTKYHKSKHTVWLMHYIPGLLKFLWKTDWVSLKSDNNVQFVNKSVVMSSLWMNCSFESDIFNEPFDPIHKTDDWFVNKIRLIWFLRSVQNLSMASEYMEYDTWITLTTFIMFS